jgi:hypothetical protein
MSIPTGVGRAGLLEGKQNNSAPILEKIGQR